MKKMIFLTLLTLISQRIIHLNGLLFYESKSYDFNMYLTALCKVSDQSLIAIGLEKGRVTIWNHTSGIGLNLVNSQLDKPQIHTITVLNNTNIATSESRNQNGKISIWNQTWSLEGVQLNKNVFGAFIELSKDMFVSATFDNKIDIWSYSDNFSILHGTLEGHTGFIQKIVKLSYNEFASVSDDGTIRLWNLTNNIMTVSAHTGGVMGLIQLSNGDLCSCGRDNNVKVWSSSNMDLKNTLSEHNATVNVVYELSNGEIISGSDDSSMIIWNITTGPIQILYGHTESVNAIVQMDNEILISGSNDHKLKVWKVSNSFLVTPFLSARPLGCYDSEILKLEGLILQSSNMTQEVCFTTCFEAGFRIAGLENGDNCICDHLSDTNGIISESKCSTPCNGSDLNEWCGGVDAVYVFRLDEIRIDLTNLDEYDLNSLSEYMLNQVINSVNEFAYKLDSTRVDEAVELIATISRVLYKIAERNTSEESVQVVKKIIGVIDTVLLQDDRVIEKAQENSGSSRNFVEILEKMGNKTRMSTNQDIMIFELSNLVMKVTKPDKESELQKLGVTSDKVEANFNQAHVKEFIRTGNNPKLTFIVYYNAKLFSTSSEYTYNQNCTSTGKIIPTIASISPIPNLSSIPDLVTIKFTRDPYESECRAKPMSKRNLTYKCVFWQEDQRKWSDYGCSYSKTTNNQSKFIHQCTCNHTTNFALLMIVDDYPFCDWCNETLKYITLAFVIVSIIGLLVTLFYDLFIKFMPSTKGLIHAPRVPRTDSEIRNHMSRQLMNVITTWFFNLVVLNCVYLAFNFFEYRDDMSQATKNSCIAIGVLLHYFLICSFCLALSISFLQYYLYFKSFRMLNFIFLKAILFSFSLPLLCVTIVLSIDTKAYLNVNKYCWLNTTYSIYSVIIPIAIMTLINLVFFTLIAINNYKMYRLRKKVFPQLSYPFEKKSVNIKDDIKKFVLKIALMLSCFYYNWSLKQNQYRIKSSKEEATYKKGISKETKLILTSFLNSTITWLFGFLVTIPGNKDWIYVKFVYALIFCLLNASLGFQIFIVYILIAKSRRKILKSKLGSVKHSSGKRDSDTQSSQATASTSTSKENSFDNSSATQSSENHTDITIDQVLDYDNNNIKL